ncbi:hypothetical protein [Seonamhaeicola marinus]|uniref:SGNH/GDSL hydrolase family protein n=1 Tax=Seonamhaeicola marinus TaxID=1912246 RepID=A0A5D0HKN8_9FLAO|nr:hypothetical protein [Seonamhaeicola marinus]TYA71858.1 hypothetical protein FUA24_20110 [Seonamhaeicola marinus]
MKKLIIKSLVYFVLLLLVLEIIVRIFHLAKDNPIRFIDAHNVEKWKPNQEGYSVTGNRKQNVAKYHINKSGFNSYREFAPAKDKIEIALVGDSFVEGFHQDYNNSIGKKIETELNDAVEVYEYGYAGYDFADQLHLIEAYKEDFNLIDKVYIYLKFKDDLKRDEYKVSYARMQLETPLNKALREVKLLVYTQNIGFLDSAKSLMGKVLSFGKLKKSKKGKEEKQNKNELYISNFNNLVEKYNYNKDKFVLFFEGGDEVPNEFLSFLNENKFKYINLSQAFEKSKFPVTLIYDKHWNNHGRDIVAQEIASYHKQNQ